MIIHTMASSQIEFVVMNRPSTFNNMIYISRTLIVPLSLVIAIMNEVIQSKIIAEQTNKFRKFAYMTYINIVSLLVLRMIITSPKIHNSRCVLTKDDYDNWIFALSNQLNKTKSVIEKIYLVEYIKKMFDSSNELENLYVPYSRYHRLITKWKLTDLIIVVFFSILLSVFNTLRLSGLIMNTLLLSSCIFLIIRPDPLLLYVN